MIFDGLNIILANRFHDSRNLIALDTMQDSAPDGARPTL
jgi:hypothetical protein